MFARRKPVFDKCSNVKHPEYERRNTRVSEYLRKYGQGKIDSLPTDNRPEIHDSRSVDEMLDNPDKVTNDIACEQLDVMLEMNRKAEDFNTAFNEIQLTKKQKDEFDSAVRVLQDKNASYEQKADAFRILEELEQKGKISRVR